MNAFSTLLCALALAAGTALACTNFLVTPGASADGSSMITYAADSHALYGGLYHSPAADYPKGTMLDVTDWDSGKYLGKIPQATHTYNVVVCFPMGPFPSYGCFHLFPPQQGNTNEHGLAIGETTYGGVEMLQHQVCICTTYTQRV